MGGDEALAQELETFFQDSGLGAGRPYVRTILPDSHYWHGNQPPLHSLFLFTTSGRPDRLAYWQDKIRTLLYKNAPDGLPGNDDGGTLSAWYLFSALGLYPIAGDDRYIIGSPLFERVRVTSQGGKSFEILAPDRSEERQTVRALRRGCDVHSGPFVRHAELDGQTLIFEMEEAP